MRGRVAELREYGGPIEIAEYDVPDPEPGGLVVRIEQAAICGSDLHVWRGETAGETASPAGLGFGHEGFGRVAALGAGTTVDDAGVPLAVGDRVVHHVMASHVGRGPNPNTQRVYGAPPYFFSTFADYFVIGPTRPVYRVPDELADDVLPPVNCAMGAAVQALRAGGAGFGADVVIFGAGGLGLTAAAAARQMGAASVVVLDRLPARLELAKRFGADVTIDVSAVDDPAERVDLVRRASGGRGADVVLELAGRAALLPEGVAMLGPRGTFVEVGLFYSGTTAAFDPSHVLRGEKRVVGSAGYPPALLPDLLDFLVRTRDVYPFAEMVSHRFALADLGEAFRQSDWATAGTTVLRAVVTP
ncbi:MAG TPA: zinc-binding dehydrogenase [Mycobacteriales bacterium]|jgi:threonine dehydrogenase-like Zn-dependent dehydrogenase|nr:zinc-binding dehydrogenase [Mycobacteriales bacterium]